MIITHIRALTFIHRYMGMAMRTGKPIHLNLADCMWNRLAGLPLTYADLETCDTYCVRTLLAIKDIHLSGVTADDFESAIPLDGHR